MILTNPTLQKVRFVISEILGTLQKQTRSRKVKIPDNHSLEPIWNTPEGILNYNGGAPKKTDGGYATGQTSRLGIAWWTDRNGNRHVKVESDRSQASNFSVPEIFYGASPFHIIFPDERSSRCVSCRYEIPAGEGHWTSSDNFECDVCVEERRYLEDTGFLPSFRRKKLK